MLIVVWVLSLVFFFLGPQRTEVETAGHGTECNTCSAIVDHYSLITGFLDKSNAMDRNYLMFSKISLTV